MVGDAGQHFAQPQFGISSVELRRPEQGVDGGRALTTSIGTAEKIVLAIM